MFTISRDFTFCYGHRLLKYNGKCAHPHGHNGLAKIVLFRKNLNDQDMVFDFGNLKQTMGEWIDANLDHQMILNKEDPLVSVLQQMGEPLFLMNGNPTAENLARLLFEQAVTLGFPVQSVLFWETEKCSAEYSAPVREE